MDTGYRGGRLARIGALFLFVFLIGGMFAPPSHAQIIGSASLNIERAGHTATRLPDGKILIVGGDNASGPVRKCEIFDPDTGQFLWAEALNNPRADHSATLLPDGKVLIIGGRDQNGLFSSTEIFDPSTNFFTPGPTLNIARAGHSATVLNDGRILVAGGDGGTAEIYDPVSQSFTPTSNMTTSRVLQGAALLQDGKVLIVGGVNRDNAVLDSAETFDPQTMTFSPTNGSMQAVRLLPTLNVLPDGKVQVIGGDAEFSMEIFDPTGQYFGALASLPPTPELLSATLSAKSRAALITKTISQNQILQGLLTGDLLTLLNRDDYSLTEIPNLNQAVVAGGYSGGQSLPSAYVVKSSQARVTTELLEVAPGTVVKITGNGFQPNETVSMIIHEMPDAYPDITISSVADASGSFINTDFSPAPTDVGRTFIVTAIGQSSGFTAQTTFSDAWCSASWLPPSGNKGQGDMSVTWGNSSYPLSSSDAATATIYVYYRANGVNYGPATPRTVTARGSNSITFTLTSSDFNAAPGGNCTWEIMFYGVNGSNAPSCAQAVGVTLPQPSISAPSPSQNSIGVNQPVTFLSTVSGGSSPTGTVTYYSDGFAFSTADLGSRSGGISWVCPGTHSITAHYSGDCNNKPTDSGPWTQTVSQGISWTSVGSSLNPSVYGQSVTFTAAVSGGCGTPTGTVQFSFDGVAYGSAVTVSNGSASLKRSDLSVGSHTVSATYNGSSTYNSSTGSLSGGQTVNPVVPTQVLVETKADGTGAVVPSLNVITGTSITVYAISRDASGNFADNVAATWSLTNITGGVVSGNLVAAGDSKSATLTGNATGSAKIHAVVSGLSSVDSGTLTVIAQPTFQYQRTITVNSGQVSGGPLTNFPMLVSITDAGLKTVANGGHVYNSNGYDIIFKDSGGTQLSHEIETYNGSTGQLLAWVKVPSITNGTVINMYYGSPTYNTAPSATGVWDINYKGVWHLKEATGSTSTDSTTNGNNGTPYNSPTQTTSKIDGGLQFNGSTQDDRVSSTFGLGTNNVTAEAWVYLPDASRKGAFIKIGGTSPNQGYAMGVGNLFENAGNNLLLLYEGARWITTGRAIGTGWHHVVMVINNSGKPIAYMDGQPVYGPDTLASPLAPQSSITYIGGYSGSGGEQRHFNGTLDEVRVSNIVRSAGWILTSYNNQNNPSAFYSLPLVENATTLSVSSASGTYGGTTTLLATLTKTYDGTPVSGKIISFTLNGTSVGTATTDASGVARLNDASLGVISVNTYPTGVGASFAGDLNYVASSGSASLTVSNGTSTITLSSTANPSIQGRSVTFIATLTPNTATGTVQFKIDGGNSGFPVPLSGGSAAISTSSLSAGTHTVAADYSGDTNNNSGTGTLSDGQTVNSITPISVSVETKSDGTGVVVPAQNIPSGASITVYAISRDASGNFVDNVSASWSLTDISGDVEADDLDPSDDTKSALFTGHETGSATIQAAVPGLNSVDSGPLTVTAAPTFQYSRTITVGTTSNPTPVSGGPLTNFPMLVSITDPALKSGANGGHVYNSNGYDIIFKALDDTTCGGAGKSPCTLSHEIEKYDGTSGTLVAWVKVPSINNGTLIDMYYGNCDYNFPPNAAAVWDSNYKLVWHLAGVDDSTNSNPGTPTGAVTFNPAGKINGATTYVNNSSSTQYISAANQPLGSLPYSGSFSYELWINVTSAYGGGSNTDYNKMAYFLDRTTSTNPLVSLAAVRNSGGEGSCSSSSPCHFLFFTRNDDGILVNLPSTGNISLGTLTHIVMVREYNSAYRLYVNGAQVYSASDGSAALTPPIPKLGRHATFGSPGYGLNGSLDEFRISNTARSAGWIQTEYNNQNTPSAFYTLGTESGSEMGTGTLMVSYPSPTIAGTAQNFTVRATNACGITTTGYTGTVHFTSSDSQAVLPADYTFVSGDNGTHTFSATLYTAGTQSITATDTGNASVTGTQSAITVNAGAVNAGNSTVSASPLSIVADGTTTSTITVTLKDVYNNPASNRAVTLTGSPAGSTITPSSGTSNPSGVVNFTVKSTVAQAVTYTATGDGTTITQTATVTFTAGPAATTYSTISGTTPVVADGVASSIITITLKDANNNAVSGVTPTFTATDTGSTNVYGACSMTNTSGVSTCTLKSTKAEVKTLSIATPVSKAGGIVTFTAGTPAATYSTITGTSPVVADGVASSTVTITLNDVYNNPVAGTTPTFSATGSNNTYGACSASNSSGLSTCTLKSTKAEVKTLSIVTPVSKTGGTVTFTAGSAVAANSTITGTGPVTADGVAASTITITLNDTYNNPVSGVTPTFSATGSNNTLVQPSVATDANGQTTGTLKSTKAEVKTLSIATPFTKTGGTVTFTAGAATKLAFTTQPGNGTGGSALSTQPVVTVQDANGNTVTSSSASITLTIGTNPSAGTLSGTNTITASSGVATFSGLSIDKAGTGYTLTASSSGLSGATSGTFNITAGVAAKLAFTMSPSNSTAGVVFPVQPVVTLQDTYGNTVTGTAQNVTVAIQNNAGPGGVLTGITTMAVGTSTGQAAFGWLSIDKTGTGYTLTATGSTVSTTPGVVVSNPFNITAPTCNVRPITVNPGQVPNGVTLTDFPMLVSITDNTLKTLANGGHVQQANGYDIHFTSLDGTALNHEIEKYDATNGILVAWVNVPSINNGTVINMYYGACNYNTPPNAEAVWDSNYEGVWHFPPVFRGLKASYNMTASANSFVYEDLTSVTNYTIQAGDYLEYDVYWTSPTDMIAFDFTTDIGAFRDSGATDQKGLLAHPGANLSAYALNGWYHRRIPIPPGFVGHAISYYDVACEDDIPAIKTAYLDNIRITDGAGGVRKQIYSSGDTITHSPHISNAGAVTSFGSSDLSALDSTSNNYDGTIYNQVVPNMSASGKIDGGAAFNGSTQYISMPSIVLSGTQTALEAWINVAAFQNVSPYISTVAGEEGTGTDLLRIGDASLANNKLQFVLGFGNQVKLNANTGLNANTWYHVAATYDNSQMCLYINGNPDACQSQTGSFTANEAFYVSYSSGGRTLNGRIDELRASSATRSGDWILTEYRNQNSPSTFYSLGAEGIAGVATTLTVSGYPSPNTAGTAQNFTVTAKDAYGNTATGYTGTVHFTSSDSQAILPADYTFVSGDNGTHTFSATLKTVGTQSITATDTGNASITGTQSNITVSKANATINVTGYTGTYDGAAHGASGTATGVGGVDLSGSLSLGATFTNVPGGTAHWTFTGGTNYSDASGDVAIVINKANAAINVTGYTGTYDGAAHGASGTATGVGGVDLSGSLNLGASFTDVPGGTAHWTFTGGTNYSDASGDVAIVINKANATINVTPYSVTYDGNAHTATGTATGVGGADLSGQLNLTGTTHTNAGTYNNDPWTFTGGTNYSDASGTVNDAIRKADASISVNGYTGIYDGNPHGASGTATGVGGVDLSGSLNLGSTFTEVPGGTAHWTFAGGTNYNDASGDVAIVINKSDQSITFGSLSDKTAGDLPFAISASSSSGLAVSFSSLTTSVCTVSGNTVTLTNLAGTCTIRASQDGDGNFNAATPVERSFKVNPGAAVTFSVVGPTSTIAGAPFDLAVTAKDAYNNTATGYTGTVTFTSTDPGSGIVLPLNFTFQTTDNGTHTFTGVILDTAGLQTVTATDTSINGISNSIEVNPGDVAKLSVSAPSVATAGSAIDVTVTAQDTYGNTVKSYTGTVHFTSTDSYPAVLPVDYSFVSGDSGSHTFTGGVTLKTTGNQTVTATDLSNAAITGTSGSILVGAGAAAKLVFGTQPSNTTAGQSISPAVTVEVEDSFGNLVDTSTASITLAIGNNAGGGTLGGTLSVNAVNGIATFSDLSIDKVGAGYTLSASSGSLTSATSNAFDIGFAPLAKFAIGTISSPQTAGTAFSISITAQDAYGNTVTSFTGTAAITSSGNLTSGETTSNFTGGVLSSHSVTISNSGDFTITATGGGKSGTSNSFHVNQATQTITVTTHAPANATYNTSFTVAATGGGSGNPVTYSSGTPSVCTNVGATFTMVSGTGTCDVQYDQAGNTTYSAAPQAVEHTTAQPAGQTITFGALGDKHFGDPDFTVSATASSGLIVSFTATGNCTVSGNSVHITGAGSCAITAHQAGDANYAAAADVPQSFNITDNTPPDTSVDSGPTSPTNATSATFAFSGTDDVTPAGSLTFECQLDSGGFSPCTSPTNYADPLSPLSEGTHHFYVKAKDAAGNVDPTPASFTWTVDTTSPIVTNVLATPNPIPVSPLTPITLTATVDDSAKGNSKIASAEYSFDNVPYQLMSASDGAFNSPTENVTATIPAFAATGVYSVCVRGTDSAGNVSLGECILLAVYDPNAGFVTGGGWIDSPAGAYTPNPNLTGKANFGFVSKYEKGKNVPTGDTEFQFHAANFNFKSTSYDWLVISGGYKAQYQGHGKVNISDNTSNFNGTAIAAGNTIWFNSVLNIGNPGSAVTILMDGASVSFTARSTNYQIPVPDALITFDPTVTSATTTWDSVNNRWVTVVPASGLAGNTFLSGVGFPVPAGGLPGGIQNVTWNAHFSSATPGLTLQWQWGAAVYTSFSTNNSALGIKPVDDNKASQFKNSDHAGTPENFKPYVKGGATGGGGSNWTGSYSGTVSLTPMALGVPAGYDYSFILTAIDGSQQGGGKAGDTFRLKVFDSNQGNAIIYDNNLNSSDTSDPTTILGGGSIVIHTK